MCHNIDRQINCVHMRTRSVSSPTVVQYLLHHLLPWLLRIFRKYWFRAALLLIAVLAIAQKNLRVYIGHRPEAAETTQATVPTAAGVAATSAHSPAMNVSMIANSPTPTPVISPAPSTGEGEEAPLAASGLATDEEKKVYIKRFAQVAQEERNRYGVPASITLAQGLLESNAGKSPLAQTANNHFGIKCFSQRCYKGHCKNYSDDSHKDFFRVYPNAWESFRAHSLFLKKERYVHLFKLGKKDYRSWARGLSKAGYATDPTYADKLIGMIEKFQLTQYD